MRLFHTRFIKPALLLGFCAAVAGWTALPAQAEQQMVTSKLRQEAEALIEKSLNSPVGFEIVESLTTEIGPRLAGSDAEKRAREWGVAKLKELGFKNVHIEPFEVDYWQRLKEEAQIISPFPQPLTITALGGSISTPEGGVSAPIVRFETLQALENAPLKGLEGKIVFVDEYMTRTQDGSGYGVAVRKRSGAAMEAGKRGALAAIIRSVGTDHHRMPHTGQMRYQDGVKKVPIAALAAPDADQLQRALLRGVVVVKLDLQVSSPGKRPSGNVIGEVPGQTDEIVLIGGHLDSWDLGTGAIDDGAGIGISVGAAKMIIDMKKKPKRTIRVVMFGAEEIGLVGARAYAKAHEDELEKHFVGAESDFGAGRIWRFDTNFGEDKLSLGEELLEPLRVLGIGPGNNDASGGPDIIPLSAAGVPAVGLKQNGWDYFDLHHTPDDTLDKINPDDLAQNMAAYAAFTWMAANMNGSFRTDEPANTDAQ